MIIHGVERCHELKHQTHTFLMSENKEKEIRLVIADEHDEFRFRVICALHNQTPAERLNQLITDDLKQLKDDDWVKQPEMIEALAEHGFSISRPTLRGHRHSDLLPTGLF